MNAVIYARYSSHNQTEQSIEGQLHDCYEYARRNDITVVGEYIDRALTGKNDDRPDFQRMIADASKKTFDRVLVWKLDRFARNRYDSAIYKYKLKQFGVKVISVMENIGDSPEAVILEAVLEATAEYYSLDLAAKINRGMRESAAKGLFVGGAVPYGYKVVDRRLAVDERKAEYIRFAFRQYADGVGKKEIMDALNAQGARTRSGKPLTISFFESVFTNEKYIGVNKYNGVDVPGGCPALIDEDTFARCAARLAAARRSPANGRSPAEYFLIGKAFCGLCGSPLGAECGRSSTGAVHHYYTCAQRKKSHSCPKKNEKKDFLEWYICEQTRDFVLDPDRIGIIADAVVAAYDKEFNRADVLSLEKKLRRIEAEMASLLDRIADPDTPKAVAKSLYPRYEELDVQKTDISIDLEKLRAACSVRYTREEICAWLRKFCEGDLFDPIFRRHLIDTFINSIYVYDDKIVIYYNVKASKQVSYIEMIESTDLENLQPIDESPKNKKKAKTESSILAGNGGAYTTKIERPARFLVCVNGLFGVVIVR